MRVRYARVVVAALLAGALPVAAHHSHGNYEMSDFTSLQGTVRELHMMNPHSWVYLDVPDSNGQVVTWALEATNTAGLLRNGIKPDEVKVGEVVRVRCHRLRDGSSGCLLGFLTPLHGDTARGSGIEKEWD